MTNAQKAGELMNRWHESNTDTSILESWIIGALNEAEARGRKAGLEEAAEIALEYWRINSVPGKAATAGLIHDEIRKLTSQASAREDD